MYKTNILIAGQPATLACDGQCKKAWGINRRPKLYLSKDFDDFCYMADRELGPAPEDPGTYEGGHPKPQDSFDGCHNKWCARECERSEMVDRGQPIDLTDYSFRTCNIPDSQSKLSRGKDYTVKYWLDGTTGAFYLHAATLWEALDLATWYLPNCTAVFILDAGITVIPEVEDYAVEDDDEKWTNN